MLGKIPAFVRRTALGAFLAAALLAAIIYNILYKYSDGILAAAVRVALIWVPLFLLARISLLIEKWRQFLLLLASFAAVVFFVVLCGPQITRLSGLSAYKLDIDHRPKPDTPNEDGIHPDVRSDQFNPKHFNIIFLGDSFAQGWKVIWQHTFPFVVEDIVQKKYSTRSIHAANFGWVSSSPVLQLRQLRDIGVKYHPSLVVQAFDMTDFGDDMKYLQRFQEAGIDPYRETDSVSIFAVWFRRIVGVEYLRPWFFARFAAPTHGLKECGWRLSNFYSLAQPLALSAPCMEHTWQAILAINQWATENGARFALFILPRYQQYHPNECPRDWERRDFPQTREYYFEPFKFFEAKRPTAPFPIHSLLPDFQQCGVSPTVFDNDPHYNETGQRIAGEAIARYLIADGFFEQ